ncbi:MAG: AsmA family protein [Haliea sp.]|nr:MAG: AsmA family protein [Haliea sp.]
MGGTGRANPGRDPGARVGLGLKLLGATAVLVAALAVLLAIFPWDWLRGPLNRYVSDRTGRHFEITRKLDVNLGRTVRILADGIEVANPGWARDPHLVKAQAAQIDLRLWPLLRGRIELPLITLTQPQVALQVEPDGRRSWALGRDTSDPGNLPEIGALVVDEGSLHFLAAADGADIRTDFAIERSDTTGTVNGAALPLNFKARGTWRNEPFTAQGRTGNVLALGAPLQQEFPAQVSLRAGGTRLRAAGTVASLKTLDGAQVDVDLQGNNLADLYRLVGVVLPETPRYALRGRLTKAGEIWQVSRISGKLGNSDLSGELAFDRSQPVPLLRGKLQSQSLDFDDLAPLVGLPERPRSAQALPQVAAAPATAPQPRVTAARERAVQRKVLPTAVLDVARMKAMNADVVYSAVRVTHVQQLPLESISTHVVLRDGVLLLDALDLGVAGGRLAGQLRIDGNSDPAKSSVKLDARALELNRLFPGFHKMQASFGKIHGEIDLRGRGNSAAQMLGTSSGDVALLMGGGEISNILLEFAGLDGGEIMKFMVQGDRNVRVRCAAASFGVEAGWMTSRAFVLDTTDTVIYGTGGISLTNESIDLTLRPYPKDPSILSLRSPLKVSGSFAMPRAGIDKSALGGRAGLALALGAVNPLLALAATIETGPGKDADCRAVLRDASAPDAAARVAATAPPPESGASAPTKVMGAPAGAVSRPGAHYPLDKRAR